MTDTFETSFQASAQDEGDAKLHGRRRPTPLFLVLEGGGAKGIAHVSAWKALEDLLGTSIGEPSQRTDGTDPRKFSLSAIAGTSAGAIVAAFIAAGATADQLVDNEGRLPLSSALGIEKFYDLFGLTGWRRLKLWRKFLQPVNPLLAAASRIAGPDRLDKRKERILRKNLGFFRRWISEPFSRGILQLQGAVRPLFYSSIVIVGLISAGWLLDCIVLSRPVSAGIDFLIFWLLAYIGFGISHWCERRIEREGVKTLNRHHSAITRTLLHPITTCVAAAGATFIIHRFTPAVSQLIGLRVLLPEWLGDGLLYGTCLALGGYTLVAYSRGFLKGAVRTRQLRKDINTALVVILTKTETLVDDSYEWSDKKPRNDAEEAFFLRVRAPEYEVTFKDLEEATHRRLNVVAADVIANEVRVYSTTTHPNFSVAFSVTASLAIPFAFRALRTWTRLLVDGGVVSSIPAWVFRRHRTRDPDARILAVGIAAKDTDKWLPIFLGARRVREMRGKGDRSRIARMLTSWTEPIASVTWPLRFAANTAYTTAYGGRSLELDASDRLDSFSLLVNFELLDFDKTRDEVKREVANLRAESRHYIEELLWARQAVFETACKEIVESLWKRAKTAKMEGKGHRIRVFWAVHEERAETVRIKRTFGFTRKDLDDRLVLPYGSTLAGVAAALGRSCFATNTVLERLLDEDMNRYRKAVKWVDRKWCWAIPVKQVRQRSAPRPRFQTDTKGVLVIESDIPLDEFDASFAAEGEARSKEWLDEGHQLLRDHRDGNLSPSLSEPGPLMLVFEQTSVQLLRDGFLRP